MTGRFQDPTPVASAGPGSNEPGVDVGQLAGHPFVPYPWEGGPLCIHVFQDGNGVTRVCGKRADAHPAEDEHAPADDRGEDELERTSG